MVFDTMLMGHLTDIPPLSLFLLHFTRIYIFDSDSRWHGLCLCRLFLLYHIPLCLEMHSMAYTIYYLL